EFRNQSRRGRRIASPAPGLLFEDKEKAKRAKGLEPSTASLEGWRSAIELRPRGHANHSTLMIEEKPTDRYPWAFSSNALQSQRARSVSSDLHRFRRFFDACHRLFAHAICKIFQIAGAVCVR